MENHEHKMIVFDLDGTLAVSKSPLDAAMAQKLDRLLEVKKVAVTSGGAFPQFRTQFIDRLVSPPARLLNLYLLPVSGTQLWVYDGAKWTEQYKTDFTKEEKAKISSAIIQALSQSGIQIDQIFGEQTEDRGSQVTFSALGQSAPTKLKYKWDPDRSKRLVLQQLLQPLLPDLEMRLGGTTSIDITKKGLNKAYGLRQLSSFVNIPIDDMLYIGDALYDGGNDAVVKETGVKTIQVKDPTETARVIDEILQS